MAKKVYVVGGDLSVRELFRKGGWINVTTVFDADLVCFTGGADVSAHLYNHPKHNATYSYVERDHTEMRVFIECVDKETPMVGICRGGQFLNVMNGGEMYQDVSNHVGPHPLFVEGKAEGNAFQVTSTHHQMMKPASHATILATGPESMVEYWSIADQKWKKELLQRGVEVVRYENALCFQPHPEFGMGNNLYDNMREYFFEQVDKLLSE